MVSEHNAVTSEETRNTYVVNNKLFRCLITLWWFLLLVITGPGSQESCRPVCHGVLRDGIFTSSQNRFTCMIATTENWFLIITESGNYYEANYPNSHLKKTHLKEAISHCCGWISGRFHTSFRLHRIEWCPTVQGESPAVGPDQNRKGPRNPGRHCGISARIIVWKMVINCAVFYLIDGFNKFVYFEKK